MTKSMRALGALSAIVLTGAATAAPARAEAMTAKDILSKFNLVTTGNVSTQSDIVGDAVIGGNLKGATVFGGGGNVPTSPVLSVYGSLTNTNGLNINAGGDLFYNGVISTPSHHVSGAPQVNFNGGGSQQLLDTATNPITNFTSPLTALSQQLAGLQATSGATISHGNFNAGSNTGIVVFDVTGQQLEADLGSNITFSGAGVTSFIINVTGDFSEPNGDNWNTLQPDALFNFSNASTVAVGNWGASILAPYAALSILNGNISGSVFAASFSGGGELHNNNLFDGALPVAVLSTAPVPEPSTWAMMFAGFAGLGFLGWRRGRKSAAAAA